MSPNPTTSPTKRAGSTRRGSTVRLSASVYPEERDYAWECAAKHHRGNLSAYVRALMREDRKRRAELSQSDACDIQG